VTPLGSPVAENVMGACPVAAKVCTTGVPGVTPKIAGPWSFGVGAGAAVEMVTVVWAFASRTCERPKTKKNQGTARRRTIQTVVMLELPAVTHFFTRELLRAPEGQAA
jgi:hypothetical protein